MDIVEHYLYTKEHEWVDIQESFAVVGITEYAQSALGDITYIELPKEGDEVDQFEHLASIESVKAASDIFAPMSGKVIEANGALESKPGLINKSCYEKGWIAKIELSDEDERSSLMTAEEYQSYLDSLGS